MSQALYRKWRPQSWEAVVGQEHVVQTLRNAVAGQRVAHAYLFAGPRGTGKTTTARLLAKAVNCLDEDLAARPCNRCAHCQAVNQGRFLDLIEIDAASNTSVEDVRDLRDKINFAPNQARYKVYIIDEVHMLSTAAFNALLKTLEEPPPHAIFILATTEAHKIPATVTSRCQRHEFRRIPVAGIAATLKEMAEQENISIEADALTLVARQSTGSMRDAISLLDQLASTGGTITLEMAQTVLGTAASQAVLDLIEALIKRQSAAGLDQIHRALDAGSDPRQFARQVVDYLRDLLLVKTGNAAQIDATTELREQMSRQARFFSSAELLHIIRLFNEAANEARGSWQPALPLEMAFVAALEGSQEGVQTPPASQTSAEKTPQMGVPAQPKSPAPQVNAPRLPAERAAKTPALAQPDPPPAPLPEDSEARPEESNSPSDQLFRRVLDNWRQVLTAVRQFNPTTQGLLNSCKPAGMKDNMLYLGFTSDFIKKKMETGSHMEYTSKALAQVLDVEIPVRCFVASGNTGSLPPEVESDGMVAAALRDLGGEIVDIQ
jgi:DNA polymerase III subunit gamma/tau